MRPLLDPGGPVTVLRLPARAVVCGVVVGVLCGGSLVARADDLVTSLDPAGAKPNGQPETLALDGSTGTTQVSIHATSGGGKDKPGCDLAGGTVVVHPWVNSTAVTVTPTTLTFTTCDEPQTLTVTRLAPGHAMVKFAFDKAASTQGVSGPAVETAHFVVGGETAVEQPGCALPAAPTFSPDGASTAWFTSTPLVSAGNGGDAIGYGLSAAGPFTSTPPSLSDGTTTVFARAVNSCGDSISDTTFHVDTAGPTAGRTATKADGTTYVEGSWTDQTVTVHTTCSDVTSGVAAGSCPADVVVDADSADTSGTTVPGGTVTDLAGNSAAVPAFVVKRDTVAPTVTRTATVTGGGVYADGSWTNKTVTVHTDCGDALSGVVDCPADVVVSADSADTAGTTVPAVTVHDSAGNSADAPAVVVKRDTAAPVVVRTLTTSAGSYAEGTWTNKTVTVHTDCSDVLSGVVACPADVVVDADSAGTAGTTVPGGTVYDVAGNSTTFAAVVVKRDTAPPLVIRTATVPTDSVQAPTAPYVPGSWTNKTVTVHTDCSDALSGVASCPADVVVSTDSATAAGTTVPAATVFDSAGNSAQAPSVLVKRDTVAPTVTVTGLVPSYSTGGTAPAPACSVVDALSGSAGTPTPVVTPPANVNGVGTWTVRCTGYDNAGNAATSDPKTYTVTYGGIGSGWLQPILAGTKFSRGKAVPGKFKVGGSPALTGFDTSGWKITAVPQPIGSKLGCVAQVGTFTLKSLNTADLTPTMRWDASGGQYIVNTDFRTATVGSCWQLKAVLDDSPATTFSSGTFQITN